ncbi:MAG: hypothetical protein ABI461_13945, partial [Polyangiaceae bacterium]
MKLPFRQPSAPQPPATGAAEAAAAKAAKGPVVTPKSFGSDQDKPSRREMIVRAGAAAGVLVGGGLIGRAFWDHGGFGQENASGARQVRDYQAGFRADTHFAELAIARSPQRLALSNEPPLTPEILVQNA